MHQQGLSWPSAGRGSFKLSQERRFHTLLHQLASARKEKTSFSVWETPSGMSLKVSPFQISPLNHSDHNWIEAKISKALGLISSFSPQAHSGVCIPCQFPCQGSGNGFGHAVCVPKAEQALMWRSMWLSLEGQMPRPLLSFASLLAPLYFC